MATSKIPVHTRTSSPNSGPPSGQQEEVELHTERIAEMAGSSSSITALVDQSNAEHLEAPEQSERAGKALIDTMKVELQEASAQSEHDKMLIDNLEAKLQEASAQSERDTTLIDKLQAENTALEEALKKSERDHTALIDEKQAKHDESMAEQVAKASDNERLVRLSERFALVEESIKVERQKKLCIKGHDVLLQKEEKLTAKAAELDLLQEHLDAMCATLTDQADPTKKQIAADLERARTNGMKHVLGADQSRAEKIQL
jgi:hypothetical protein